MQTAQEVILSKLQRYACLHRYDMQTSVETQPRLGLTNMCFIPAGPALTYSTLTEACGAGGTSSEASGLLPGLTMQDVLWAMMARPQSHQNLLDACMRLVLPSQFFMLRAALPPLSSCLASLHFGNTLLLAEVSSGAQVPAEEVVEVKQEPKIDFTYSGQQRLDLGFGASGRQSLQQAKTLSWARLKQVCPGDLQCCTEQHQRQTKWLAWSQLTEEVEHRLSPLTSF